jgi:hypothetical protein
MASLASILLAVALGGLLVYRFGGVTALRPRWAGWLLLFGAGAALGIALTACLFFILLTVFPGMPHLSLWVRLALVAAAAYECRRHRQPAAPDEIRRPYPYAPLLWIAFAAALLFVTFGMSTAWEANPQGKWDAWSIWNLRAKFLAAGDGLASRAWSPALNFTHPEYPLLLSSFVASCWTDAGAVSPEAPLATSYVFFLALLAMVTGGIAALRGPAHGLLAGICLMGVPALLAEVPAQYSDVPLACFFAGALLFALLDRPVIAGVLAACAAWTKDEGILFLAILFVAVAVWKRPKILRFCCGAAPVAALVLVFKFVIARGTHSLVNGAPAGLVHQLTDFSRYQATASAMVREIFAWNVGWYHPLLPIAILLIALRMDRRHFRDALFSAAIASAMVLGYFGVYVVTPNDLQWQLQTSLTRLFVQVSPIVLIAAFVAMRVPEAALATDPVQPDSKPRRKAKR